MNVTHDIVDTSQVKAATVPSKSGNLTQSVPSVKDRQTPGGRSTIPRKDSLLTQTSRSKLPWLDGNRERAKASTGLGRSVPGAYVTDASSSPSSGSHKEKPRPSTSRPEMRLSLTRDPSIRAIGSVPSFPKARLDLERPKRSTSVVSTNTTLPTRPLPRKVDHDSISTYSSVSSSSYDTQPVGTARPSTERLIPPGAADLNLDDITSQLRTGRRKSMISEKQAVHGKDGPNSLPPTSPPPGVPKIFPSVPTSPLTVPLRAQKSTSSDDTPMGHSLKRAITHLENLMSEAITVAKDAADQGRSDEVAHVLQGAHGHLRRASTGQPPTIMDPLPAPSSSSATSVYSSFDDDDSSIHTSSSGTPPDTIQRVPVRQAIRVTRFDSGKSHDSDGKRLILFTCF